MMASVQFWVTASRKRWRMSRDSGVVCSEGRIWPARWVSMVPMRRVLRLAD